MLYCMNYVEKEPTHYEPALSLVYKIVVPLFGLCVLGRGGCNKKWNDLYVYSSRSLYSVE